MKIIDTIAVITIAAAFGLLLISCEKSSSEAKSAKVSERFIHIETINVTHRRTANVFEDRDTGRQYIFYISDGHMMELNTIPVRNDSKRVVEKLAKLIEAANRPLTKDEVNQLYLVALRSIKE